MTKDPEARISTFYEWVVETVDVHDEDSEDIIDCSYWAENERKNAEADFAATQAPAGGRVDFALCRRTGNEDEGDLFRGYAYRNEDGSWPTEFDCGHAIPARFFK